MDRAKGEKGGEEDEVMIDEPEYAPESHTALAIMSVNTIDLRTGHSGVGALSA